MNDKFTPEKVFTKLMHLRKFFTPFNWEKEFNISFENYTIKNIHGNKSFKSHIYVYEKMCQLYPMAEDINSIIYGFFLVNNHINIYSLSLNNCSTYISNWNSFKRSYGNTIKNEVESIKSFLILKNIKINEILTLRNEKLPILYEMYSQEYISGITMAAIYNKSNILNIFIELSKENSKNIEKQIFLNELYKYTKMLQILKYVTRFK